jgi:hypothetical protein
MPAMPVVLDLDKPAPAIPVLLDLEEAAVPRARHARPRRHARPGGGRHAVLCVRASRPATVPHARATRPAAVPRPRVQGEQCDEGGQEVVELWREWRPAGCCH